MRYFVHGFPRVSRRTHEDVLRHEIPFGNIYTLLLPFLLSSLLVSPSFHSPSSQCLKWLLRKLSSFTPVLQVLMPKLYVQFSWIYKPTDRYCLLSQLHHAVSFLFLSGPQAGRWQHFQSDCPFQSLHYWTADRIKLFKSRCKTSEERTYHAKLMLCYETPSFDVLAQSNHWSQQNWSPIW